VVKTGLELWENREWGESGPRFVMLGTEIDRPETTGSQGSTFLLIASPV
jgi:hypothetical protein